MSKLTSDNMLSFTEELTGWDVSFTFPSGRSCVIGRLELCYERGVWVYDPNDRDALTLPELDQIRHKLANLEQTRLSKEALSK